MTPPPGGPRTYGHDALGHDAFGRPWTRTTGASIDTYAYLGSTTSVWQIANSGGGVGTTSSALDATGARTAISGAGARGYLAFDLHGNLVAAENGAKVITDALRYDAWGEVLANPVTSALPTPWRYQGRLDLSPDAANPLYDYGARTYRPVQGAFTSLDTYAGAVIDPLSMNRFLYAEANPTSFVDPDGHAVFNRNLTDGGSPGTLQPGDSGLSPANAQAAQNAENRVTNRFVDDVPPLTPPRSLNDWRYAEMLYEWADDVAAYGVQQEETADLLWDLAGFAGPVGPFADGSHALKWS